MKKMKLFTICMLLLTVSIQAQDVKNQSEIIKENINKGEYTVIADYNNIKIGQVMTISDLTVDRNQPTEHFEVFFKENPKHQKEYLRERTTDYYSDHVAFPVTYFSGTFEGNDKLKKAVGYVVNKTKYSTDRIVFLENYIFVIDRWNSKDDYNINYILKNKGAEKTEENTKGKKKKKGGFFKKLKQGMKAASSGGKEPYEKVEARIKKLKGEVLQPYLDKATAKQKSYYANWVKNPANAKTENYLKDKSKMMEKAIKKYNDDIFNSPEYQRMLAYHKWMKNNTEMTVYNKTGSKLWVGSSKNAHITTEIESGNSVSTSCRSDMYYYFADENGTLGRKFYTGDTKCGGSITIN